MAKKLKDFNKEECLIVLNSILNNKKHIDKDKTMSFLKILKNIKNEDREYILKYSEIYYYHMKHFFKFNRDEKMLYLTQAVQEFKKSNLTCCLQVLNHEDLSNILEHTLTVDHFIHKHHLKEDKKNDIKAISDYFFATGHVNTKELNLIIELITNNKNFQSIIE